MEDDTLLPFSLPAVQRKKVTAAFDGGRLTSDGGVLLLSGADRQLGLCATLAAVIPDHRDACRVTHHLEDILRARVFAIACGYPDADDLDDLRCDPAFKLACGRLPESGDDLASQPTISRWENAPDLRTLLRLGTDVTSRLGWSRYSPSSSFSRAKNHITPNIKTRPPAKPAAAPHIPAVVPPIIPPTAAPTTVKIIGRRQPMICIADLSDRSHCSLFPRAPIDRTSATARPLAFTFLVLSEPRKPACRFGAKPRPISSSGPRPFPWDRRYQSFLTLYARIG